MKYIPNAMKFDTQSRSSLLTVNTIFENCGSWPEIGQIWSQNCNMFQLFQNLHLVQIEHANYKYGTWNWWSWPKVIDSDKFCSNTEICSDFYEIWHSQQMEHANYEYNTRHGLERLRDYWLRMIIGCKIWLTLRTYFL